MLFHLLVALAMVASVIAFIILWYFWVKKKLTMANVLDGEQNILFPFKHFAWLLIGLIVVTCLVQVHFTRVSSGVYEDLNAMASFLEEQRTECKNIRELERSVKDLRKDVNTRLEGLRELSEKTIQNVMKTADVTRSRLAARMDDSSELPAQTVKRANAVVKKRLSSKRASRSAARKAKNKKSKRLMFAGAARAASPGPTKEKSADPVAASESSKQIKADHEPLSMKLDLKGTVKAGALLVRKNPEPKAQVVDKIRSGETVKVSEKRIVKDQMWYAVTTPHGKSGWVDFRYIKLQVGPSGQTSDS